MIKYAFRVVLSVLVLHGALAFAAADSSPPLASPVGEWRVKDGTAHIRILLCGARLRGVISWADKPGTDVHNPDASKRNRPVLGLPIVTGMRHGKDNRWEGEIYNAENGKMYDGSISMKATDTLHIEGCLLKGIFCGGEDWSRLDPAQSSPQSDAQGCERLSGEGT